MQALTHTMRSTTASSRWNQIAPLLPVALMCAVALVQFAYAHTASLSPWKGGGFGMFSTVDSPAARFLRIYLVTADGDIPVLVPDALRAPAHKLRTVASKSLAYQFADALTQTTWVGLRLMSAVDYYRYLLQQLVHGDRDDRLLYEIRQHPDILKPSIEQSGLNFVRALEADEAPGEGDRVIDVDRVRVEVWKYVLSQEQQTLHAERLLVVQRPYPI